MDIRLSRFDKLTVLSRFDKLIVLSLSKDSLSKDSVEAKTRVKEVYLGGESANFLISLLTVSSVYFIFLVFGKKHRK